MQNTHEIDKMILTNLLSIMPDCIYLTTKYGNYSDSCSKDMINMYQELRKIAMKENNAIIGEINRK